MRPKPTSISLNYVFLLEKQESYNFKLVAKRKCLLLMQFFLCSKLFSKLETNRKWALNHIVLENVRFLLISQDLFPLNHFTFQREEKISITFYWRANYFFIGDFNYFLLEIPITFYWRGQKSKLLPLST